MLDLLERVEDFIRRHRLLAPGERVLVAVSGGPDSLALLHLFTRLKEPWRLELHAAHVNHGLRADAAEDAAFVAATGEAWGVPVHVVNVDVRAERRTGESLQQAARRLRYRGLLEIAQAVGAARIALGHHADDQAETVLMRLLRGAGTTGLAGIRPRRGPYIRPLLAVTRAEIEAYCREFQLKPRTDPSNLSLRYLRNRVRHELLPLLEREYNPNIRAVLARTAALLREEDDLLEALAARAHHRMQDGRGPADLPAAGLARLPAALARRVVRRALQAAGVDVALVSADHMAAILALVAAPGAVTLPGGVRVGRRADRLVVERFVRRRAAACGQEPPATLPVPGEARLPRLNVSIHAELVEPPRSLDLIAEPRKAAGPERAVLDWDRIVPPLVVRTWRPGDRMRPLGMTGSKKVQDIFVDAKVPKDRRASVPIVADQEGILWVVGLRVDARAAVGPGTRRVLVLRATADSSGTGDGSRHPAGGAGPADHAECPGPREV